MTFVNNAVTNCSVGPTLPGLSDTLLTTDPQSSPATDAHTARANWYALYTCARHEKHVAEQITQRRISCFLPVYRSVRRWKDRRKELELPLFPGYVFARVTPQEYLRVLQVAGVVRFVGFNGRPVPVADSEMECLMHALKGGVRAEPHPYLTEGRRVRVKSGPLASAEGILVRRKDKCRVVLSLALIMRSVIVEVDEADIEPCETRSVTFSSLRKRTRAFGRPNEADDATAN